MTKSAGIKPSKEAIVVNRSALISDHPEGHDTQQMRTAADVADIAPAAAAAAVAASCQAANSVATTDAEASDTASSSSTTTSCIQPSTSSALLHPSNESSSCSSSYSCNKPLSAADAFVNLVDDVNETRRHVDCDQFKLETLQNLFKFKNENLFTDVSIYVDGIEFPCHKVVLCAASSYFKAMFSCDLRESRLGKVYIESISPWTMKRLIDFIYTGKIEINYENVIDVFNAAMMFQLNILVDKCTAYIQDHIDVSNCVEVHIFACIHNLTQLEHDTFAFILDNFMLLLSSNESSTADEETTKKATPATNTPAASNMSDFVHLNEATFAALLKSDSLNVSREIYAYYALKKWTEHRENDHDEDVVAVAADKVSRIAGRFKMQQVFENLFKYIRLNSLSRDELEYVVSNDEYVKASQTLSSKIKHILHIKYYATSDRLDLNKYLTNEDDSPMSKKAETIPAKTASSSKISATLSDVSPKPPSGHNDDLLKRINIIKNSMERNIRPSTIPREYLCMLHGDTFQLYDFYKSKWETLTSWPPLLNRSSVAGAATTGLAYNSSSASFQLGHPESSEAKPRPKLNGFSTCLVNNILYVTGGYLVDSLSSPAASHESGRPLVELVDGVWRFDPVKGDWATCQPMLRKRAFHLSISLISTGVSVTSAAASRDYLFLFYGVCYEGKMTTAPATSDAAATATFNNKLITCFSVEYYNIEADNWSILNLNKSLLSQHLFQSVHLNSRSYQTQTAAVAAASAALNSNLAQNSHQNDDEDAFQQRQEDVENQAAETVDNRMLLLNNLLEHQRNLVRSIVSLRNLIYILKENCIHCYEFNSTLGQLNCLPYFCLPANLSTFHLATAVPVKTSSSACMSVFTWLSEDEDDMDGFSSDSAQFKRQFTKYCRKATAAKNAGDNQKEVNENAADDENDSAEDELTVCKKEALIYLINPQQRSVYEFYPAKNKLKQMPNFLLPHSPKDTFLLDINSKLFATGGIIAAYLSSNSSSFDESPSSTTTSTPTATTANRVPGVDVPAEHSQGMAIEKYDKETRTWSIFMGANWQPINSSATAVDPVLASDRPTEIVTQGTSCLPVQRHFFKLKTSFV